LELLARLTSAAADQTRRRARAAFAREPRLDLQSFPVRLSFADGVLSLEGEVEDIAAKQRALEREEAVPGVEGLVDRVRVAPRVPMSDEAIRDHVRDALYQEPAFATFALNVGDQAGVHPVNPATEEPFGVIAVVVDSGLVTLDGQVPSLSHKRPAGVLGWWVPGVRDLINGLAVEPSQQDSDDEITDAVRLVLEKDRFVLADHIRVHCHNRVVTLEEVVPSDSIREMAEFDTWYVFGVDRVSNLLAVHR
jgi:osmotically-inducible protein OsmY